MFENNQDIEHNESLGEFLESRGYSELFVKAYLVSLIVYIRLVYFVFTINNVVFFLSVNV
jgi:hypothetical protein